MTINVPVNREAISMVVGLVVLVFSFVTLMWSPDTFINVAWAVIVLAASAFIAGMVTLGVYNLIGALSDEDDSEDDDVEEDTE